METSEKKRIYGEMVKLIGNPKTDLYDDMDAFQLYAKFFNEIGETRYLSVKDGKPILSSRGCDSLAINKVDRNKIPVRCSINASDTIKNISEKLDGLVFKIKTEMYYIIGDNVIIYVTLDHDKETNVQNMIVTVKKEMEGEISDIIISSIETTDSLNEKNTYRIAYRGQYSIETTTCEFDDWNTDISKNYNDDIPFVEMNEIIRRDKASLMLFYGKPGTGKTSIIKSLINENPDKNFIFIDTSICDSISDGRFLDFMEENRGSVIVFEDCERLLASRKNGANNALSTILNLTDGLIAESMKLKFICTFNCDISTIDEAVLRKGRLTLKYEFKELTLEKAKAIYPNAEKPMTLGDVYNAEIKNDFSAPSKPKIGFI